MNAKLEDDVNYIVSKNNLSNITCVKMISKAIATLLNERKRKIELQLPIKSTRIPIYCNTNESIIKSKRHYDLKQSQEIKTAMEMESILVTSRSSTNGEITSSTISKLPKSIQRFRSLQSFSNITNNNKTTIQQSKRNIKDCNNKQQSLIKRNGNNQNKIKKMLTPTRTPNWISVFTSKSLVTSGLKSCNRSNRMNTNDFAYDLSPGERKFLGVFKSPMKPASEQEQQLLRNGQRIQYLNQRYEQSPDIKYNYPEATSWRIGWLHNEQRRSNDGQQR